MEYRFNEIEKKWQDKWKADKAYKVSNDSAKPKYYVLDMFPYPSGAGLHVGHPLGYIASDIYSRYKRLKGFNVLHPMGFDSFGLPAEQYAIETGQHPAETTKNNIATFKAQLDKIGFCYDWDREVRTSDPQYYKWTQWIFLEIFNSYFDKKENKAKPITELIKQFETEGNPLTSHYSSFTSEEWKAFDHKKQQEILMEYRLAFSKYGEVNWCEALGTVLANDEVVNGVSERGGYPVIKKKMRQWYLRITDYADRLLEGLEKVDFSDSMKEMQRNWIGKSQGAEISFDVVSSELSAGSASLTTHHSPLTVYTTRPDTIFGVDFMVVAPELNLVQEIKSAEQATAVDEYIAYVKSRSDVDRMAEKKITGCFTGAYAINPFSLQKIPIYISEYVLAGYGTGAIMAVPCGDDRDFKFAHHFNIPITNIIGAYFNGTEANATKEATLENSGFLNGMKMMDASEVVLQKLEDQGIGKRKVNYRMRDAGFSRQRYWGEPFPIIWTDGVAIPLDAAELPLELPHVDKYGPGPEGEGPLANISDWVNLTPSPSPGERGVRDHGSEELTELGKETGYKKDIPGYFNSTGKEWHNTLGFAKENRQHLTEAEAIIWYQVRDRKMEGFKFRRQHPIAGYIPDFVCLEQKLIIEIDGGYHDEAAQKKFDGARQSWLAEKGFEMIRFTSEEVTTNLKEVLKTITKKLKEERNPAIINADNSKQENSSKAAGLNSPLPWRGAGGEVRRETSTMPGYAGSSWYFLRYMDPQNSDTFCDRKASDYWNQVDLYIGGTEHAVGHLLYSRLWTKVLFDLGKIGFDEPFRRLVNQGMIQGSSRYVYRVQFVSDYPEENKKYLTKHILVSFGLLKDFVNSEIRIGELIERLSQLNREVKEFSEQHSNIGIYPSYFPINVNIVDGFELDINKLFLEKPDTKNDIIVMEDGKFFCKGETEKMSKRLYNTVNPNELCDKYGADTFRMYEMFLGPVEASKPWDTKGIEGVHRFLRKLWRLFFDDIKGKVWTNEKATNAELKILHRTIKKIEEDTERFSFNTAVSAFMICVNDLFDVKCHKKEVLEKILILLVPYAPHIAEELWHQLDKAGTILDAAYPTFDAALLVESSKEYPISINGKVRANINLALNLEQAEVEKMILQNEVVQKWLEGKDPKKIIYVKNKMVNVVV